MSNNILDNINNAVGGQPYNGAGISLSGTGQGSSVSVSNINGGAVNLDRPMKLTHSLDGIKPMNLNESGR